jgi:alpha-L-fucosidase
MSLEQKRWQSLGYGMFIHFGMSTFEGVELPLGQAPSALYNPSELDVEQWLRVAKDAVMKYAILSAKHVSGHCLWPSSHTDYHVGTSGNPTDVVAEFVKACRAYGIAPGLYYCSMDNHHKFGSKTPSDVGWDGAYFTTHRYHEFQTAQLEELLTHYGELLEVWIDIPQALPRGYREELYQQIKRWQPDALVAMNQGLGAQGRAFDVKGVWPTDILTLERTLPITTTTHLEVEGSSYEALYEVCDTLGKEWFWTKGDKPRSDQELLGMYLVTRSRGANLLLDVAPDQRGLIPGDSVAALLRLRENLGKIGLQL